MDFGLGIGYNPESSASSQNAPSRPAAVNSLKTGMMAQFKSNFVAAASNSQNQVISSSSNMQASKRPAMTGFVSGGTIGGDAYKGQTAKSSSTPASGVNPTGQRPTENAGRRSSERLAAFPAYVHYLVYVLSLSESMRNGFLLRFVCFQFCSSRDKTRERRRPSGWDR